MDSQKEQFSQIYREYIEKIYRFVYLKVDSQETAEDLTSKVFLKGWEAYSGEAQNPKSKIQNVGAFLYQIARNAVVDHYRAKEREKTVSIDDIPERQSSDKGSHEMAVLSADIEHIKKSIQGLKKDYQDVIIWHYLDDMSLKEIAQLVNKPEGTVRVMLHRGLKDLREIIQEA